MSVPVRTVSGPINRNAWMAGLLATTAWQVWTTPMDGVTQIVAAGLCSAVAVPLGLRAGILLFRDYQLRRNLLKAEMASSDHGTGREATWEELIQRHMHDPASGNFLGLEAATRPVFAPPKTPFSLIEMPPGVGKTVNYVIGSILHQARLGKSLFIPDVKCELAPVLVGALRDMGVEVWCINPAKVHPGLCDDTEVNLYQPVLDAYQSPDTFRQDTIKLALDLAELHLPEKPGGEDKNVYFRNGSRRCICIAILSQAMLEPALCTPSDVFALLNDPAAFKKRLLKLRYEIARQLPGDAIAAFLQTEAANLLDRFAHNEENAASFLEGATQTLLSFNQGGRMAGYGRAASVNIADMRKRQIAVFVMSPLSHARDFAPVVSLLNHSLFEVAKREPAGHPVHIVGEEALNYRFADIVSDMETMRGLKISADFYIQSFNGLVHKYGQEAAAAIEAYSDVKVYAGLNSLDRARHVSDMLAEGTIRRQDYSYKADVKDIGVSSRELGRRLMTPDEILAMDRGQAWVFVRGLRPLRLTMIDYGRIGPWRDQVADNPLEGSRLRSDPVFAIGYPGKLAGKPSPQGPVIDGVNYRVKPARQKPRRVQPVRARHLLWLPVLLAVWGVGLLDLPMPHLRIAYVQAGTAANPVYERCDYAGPNGRTLMPGEGTCPLIVFFSKQEAGDAQDN